MLTPIDLEERYGLTSGHIHHGELALDQLFTMRPILGCAQYRTPIDGLFLCGAGTHPGGGITGLSGRNAAREIARSLIAMRQCEMRRLTALGARFSSDDEAARRPIEARSRLGFRRVGRGPARARARVPRSRADPTRIRELHRELTAASSGRIDARSPAGGLDRAAIPEAGLDDVRITTHEVLLPRPLEVSVEMTQPHLAGGDARAADGARRFGRRRPARCCRITPTRPRAW